MLGIMQRAVGRLPSAFGVCNPGLASGFVLSSQATQFSPCHQSELHTVCDYPDGCVARLEHSSLQQSLDKNTLGVRNMSFLYGRKLADKSYLNRNYVVEHSGGLTEYLVKVVPKYIKFAVNGPPQSCGAQTMEPTIYTTPEHLYPLTLFLRDHINTQYKCLIDITAVDFPERQDRFEVVYHLLSPRWNNRIRVKVCVDETTAMPSIVKLYNAANWFEREVWDMFGIFFKDHPDLRRILTDYGFTGHPMRKDFPLTGYTEVRYDYGKKRVISEPLELSQEFRYFDFSSPWDTLPR